MAKAVFLDRDETLNPDSGYISDPDLFALYRWVPTELLLLKQADFMLILVSNQSGIGRGKVTHDQLIAIHQKLNRLLYEEAGIGIDDFSICPHTPDDECDCRKPKPKLLLDAAERNDIDLSASFMIGDRESDYEAGIAAGVRQSFLIVPGDEESFKRAVATILATS
jgi:D-glycero-D-manno-heptose 1,7-bisphosphate phosphatase